MVVPQPGPGRQERAKGLSLLSVLVLISIVMVVAAAMTGVFTLNMNITQKASNGTIALSEAEAGVTEVLYQVTREGNVKDRNGKNPEVTWGQNGETIRGTITPEMGPNEAYHVVTFDTKSSFPYSTNNTTLDNDKGYLGRIVPDGMIHVISTGYCKGQYRTVECVLEKPPFPFGLATSGPIVSVDPMVVKGTNSAGSYDPDKDGDRPGHLLCNSPEGVTIGSVKGRETEISGFVKSAGPVNIAQPAIVRGGIRSYAETSTITDINIKSFDLAGQSGVVTLLDNLYSEEAELDVMYWYSGSQLRFARSVNLKQAMLYVQGDLVIDGPVQGEGLIVVDGNVTFKSGTALLGSNKMAVLASGDVTIQGNNNYFIGLVYCEGNLKASNITILGNTIVNSDNPSKGRADLQNVTVVSNRETADMTITITSSSQATYGSNAGEAVPPLSFNGAGGNSFGYPGPGDAFGYINANDKGKLNDLGNTLIEKLWDGAVSGVKPGAEAYPDWTGRPTNVGNAGYLWDAAQNLYEQGLALRKAGEAVAAAQADVDSKKASMPDKDDPGRGQAEKELAEAEKKLDEAKSARDALLAEKSQFEADVRGLVQSVYDYVSRQTDSKVSFKDGLADLDIKLEKRFNLNQYLPESERVKVSFWKVYSQRL